MSKKTNNTQNNPLTAIAENMQHIADAFSTLASEGLPSSNQPTTLALDENAATAIGVAVGEAVKKALSEQAILPGAPDAKAETKETPSKKTSKKPKKETKEAPKKKEEPKDEAEETQAEPAEEQSQKGFSRDEVIQALQKAVKKYGFETIKPVIQQAGVVSATEIQTQEQFSIVMNGIAALGSNNE